MVRCKKCGEKKEYMHQCKAEKRELPVDNIVRRCGNCKYWNKKTVLNRPPFGECTWDKSRPFWLKSDRGGILFAEDGTMCNEFTA